jgi:DNA-binding ferritin-like protein
MSVNFKEVLREGIMDVVHDEEKVDLILAICESVAKSASGAEEARTLMEASADTGGGSYEVLKTTALWLLVESSAFTIVHWNVDRNLRHELCDQLYTLFHSTSDSLAETYEGIVDRKIIVKKLPPLSSTDDDPAAVLKHIKEIRKKMQDILNENEHFGEGIKNIFADFDEQMNEIIYKWTRFAG